VIDSFQSEMATKTL